MSVVLEPYPGHQPGEMVARSSHDGHRIAHFWPIDNGQVIGMSVVSIQDDEEVAEAVELAENDLGQNFQIFH